MCSHRIDRRPDLDLLLSIHDEVIAEAPVGACDLKEFESLMAEASRRANLQLETTQVSVSS
jgi:hypothetical protein